MSIQTQDARERKRAEDFPYVSFYRGNAHFNPDHMLFNPFAIVDTTHPRFNYVQGYMWGYWYIIDKRDNWTIHEIVYGDREDVIKTLENM